MFALAETKMFHLITNIYFVLLPLCTTPKWPSHTGKKVCVLSITAYERKTIPNSTLIELYIPKKRNTMVHEKQHFYFSCNK